MEVMKVWGAPQMLRSSSAHVGTGSLVNLSRMYKMGAGHQSSVQESKSFASYLADAATQLNGKQLEVNRIQQQLVTDPDSVDVHDVTTAMAKAQLSLSLAQTVIDRLITNWNEISTTK